MDVEKSDLSQQNQPRPLPLHQPVGNSRLTRSQMTGINLQSVQNQDQGEVQNQVGQVHEEEDVQEDIRIPMGRGEQVDLAEWLEPLVPGPLPPPLVDDADGWSKVDTFGVWECALCEFQTLEEVPSPYMEK